MDLPDDPLPTIVSTPHDIMLANRPKDEPLVVNSHMDSSWGDCLITPRHSFGGILIRRQEDHSPISHNFGQRPSTCWPTHLGV
jgi:hypothetical protein